MSPIFSIIVPFYNTEAEYYERTFSCLKALSPELAEVLVIDDGSKTQSAMELELYLSLNLPNSTVIHKANGGQNSARQFGIDHAAGKYVLFLDSDDLLDIDAVIELADYLEDNTPAVVAFGHDVVTPRGELLRGIEPWASGFNKLNLHRLALNSDSLCRQCYCLHRLKEAPFNLVQGVRIGEDLSSAMSLNLELGEGVSFGRVLYHYVVRPTSIIQKPPKSVLFDIFDAFDEVIRRCGPDYSGCQEEIEWMAILHCVYWGGMRIVQADGFDLEMQSRVFEWIDKAFPGWRSNSYLSSGAITKSLRFRLLVRGHWSAYRFLFKVKGFVKAVHAGGEL